MERNLTEKEIEQIKNIGAFGYSIEKCAYVLGWDYSTTEKEFNDKNSAFYKNYMMGKIRSDYVIDLKLFEQAQAGDIKSLEKLELRKRLNK